MSTYSIFEADDIYEYKDLIQQLWAEVHSYTSPGRFEWLYEDNPKGRAITYLAIENGTQELAGSCAVYPWHFFLEGEEIKAGIAIDYGVKQNHRVYGPAVSIQKAIVSSFRKKGFRFIFVYPNMASSSVLKRAGYNFIGSSKYWMKILRSERIISKRIRVPLVAYLFDKMLLLIDLFYKIKERGRFVVEITNQCDERFDDLWKSEGPKYHLSPDQSAGYLNWRYSKCLTTKYQYFCLYSEDVKHLKAFIIYAIKNKAAIIKDIFPAHSKYVKYLLAEFSCRMRKEGVESIGMSYFGNSSFIKLMKKVGFVETNTKRDYFILLDEEAGGLGKDLFDKNNFYFFYG